MNQPPASKELLGMAEENRFLNPPTKMRNKNFRKASTMSTNKTQMVCFYPEEQNTSNADVQKQWGQSSNNSATELGT